MFILHNWDKNDSWFDMRKRNGAVHSKKEKAT